MIKKNGQALVTFEMLTEFYHEMIKPQFDQLNTKIDKGFKELSNAIKRNSQDIRSLKTEVRYLKDDINGIKADLSVTVNRKEFNDLKEEVKELSAS